MRMQISMRFFEALNLSIDNGEDMFNHEESETLQLIERSERVAHPKQLGEWITLWVNGTVADATEMVVSATVVVLCVQMLHYTMLHSI